jgi:hypothetical protein
MRKLIFGLIAIVCVAEGQLCAGNLLTNGDFEQGNTGFSSGYSYSPTNGWPATVYTIASSPKAWRASLERDSFSTLPFLVR